MSRRDPADDLKTIAREMTQRIRAVEALHVPVFDHSITWCLECTRSPDLRVPWPCPTIKAAQGDDIQ